jgi:Holliday junction DNA helicase RuvA
MVVECAGVGYELNISLNTYTAYTGRTSGKVFVHEVIREDAYLLFGFGDKRERELFVQLTSVSGVGPNTARTILSSLPPDELVRAIISQNEAALKSVKGIGAKTAQRILIDLKNNVKPAAADGTGAAPSSLAGGSELTAEEAVAALVMLGFQKAAAQKAVTAIQKSAPGLKVEELIKGALRVL